ncbi:MAG: hypothetical protein KDH20_01300 [Rhodocyclaceae bacterium]|nr:hypothetical protein [Rhodocyclaceae bacterium]
MRGTIKHALLAGLTICLPLLSNSACADDAARIRALEEKLERSLTLIEALQRKVEALEAERQPVAAAPAVRVAPAAPLRTSAAPPLRGFADVVGAHRSGNHHDGSEGFAVGNLDLYLTPDLGGKVRSLVELVFEMEHDGESIAEIERAQIGYAFGDALTLWAGRYHYPFGYWNTAFHHGAQLQTAITRPRFLAFEDHGGILPMHGVGLWATGRLDAGDERLRYHAYMANAPSVNEEGVLDVHAAGRDGFRASTGLTLAWQPAAVRGLEVGLHGLRTRADLPDGSDSRIRMLGGFAAYLDGPVELIAEGYHFDNDNTTGAGSRESTAWFLQGAYAVGRVTPFVRLERTSLDDADPYFAALGGGRSYRRAAFGLRVDVTAAAALKLELAQLVVDEDSDRDERGNEAFVQYAIRF